MHTARFLATVGSLSGTSGSRRRQGRSPRALVRVMAWSLPGRDPSRGQLSPVVGRRSTRQLRLGTGQTGQNPATVWATRATKVPEAVIIRITRPYQSVEEYLEAEADTIDNRGMLLVDADPLPKNTPVRFVVSIATGEQLIRAEGTSRSYLPKSPEARGGLRVWFKRYGVATKEIIDRASAIRERRQTSRSAPGAGSGSDGKLQALRSRPRHSRPPPPNRDELLGRLRARNR